MKTHNSDDNLIPIRDSSGQRLSGLYKSEKTRAIVVEKSPEYQRYLRDRENIKHVRGLENQVETLKSEVNELKDLLRQSLENKTE